MKYPFFDSTQLKTSRTECFDLVRKHLVVSHERRAVLDTLAGAIQEARLSPGLPTVHLVFICTHNSRRSQLAQIWSQCIADELNLGFLSCHSAGTEQTDFHPNAISALVQRGFLIEKVKEGTLEAHDVRWNKVREPMRCFSKTLDAPSLPKAGFVAVSTCNDADRVCPFIEGASHRISLPFSDPKGSDSLPHAMTAYAQVSDEIALEMLYVLGQC